MNNLINNKKYLLIYLASIIIMASVWCITIEPTDIIVSDTDRMEIEPKEVFGYVNELIGTILGVINIVTFGYQMRDRRRKKNENEL